MSQNYYKELSEKLFERTKWSISIPTFSWVLPELTINFNSTEVYKIKLLTDRDTLKTTTRFKKTQLYIYVPKNSDENELIKYIYIEKFAPSATKPKSVTRTINIKETTDIEYLIDKIVEEVPFRPIDKIPQIF
jgi:hypothetical protein